MSLNPAEMAPRGPEHHLNMRLELGRLDRILAFWPGIIGQFQSDQQV